ncbi:MAG: alpha-glucan family phosphorylase [Candidatus Lokiarchaeota archaeon]|nr:alpha-glucan family phosphorylase [Candidatus Lokiarchaeota archaeon]
MRRIAYFSMEIGAHSDIPTYSGGLGVLAGDTIRSAADLEIPMVAVTLCYDKGYFFQIINGDGYQVEHEIRWDFSDTFDLLPKIIDLEIQGKKVKLGAWKYEVKGEHGWTIPVYLLDTDVEGNEQWQRNFTHVLYDSTPFQRIVQEVILGIGGAKLLEELGYKNISTYHMNEGHAAFLTLYLFNKFKGDLKRVKEKCVFTTHTPVPAGHDQFDYNLVKDVLRGQTPDEIRKYAGQNDLNMTKLALSMSRYINGVSKKHGEVSRNMFPGTKIDYITNGVHSRFWTNPHLTKVLDSFETDEIHWADSWFDKIWKLDADDLWRAHTKAKYDLLDYEKSNHYVLFDREILTIGFARRFTGYKRATLIFNDLEKLAKIAEKKIQFLFAGKAHPRDDYGKSLIKMIDDYSEVLWNNYRIKVAFLENYDMDLAKIMISGCDVWLNNPIRYREASGTSGMKAAHNGLLNLSVLDGWWIEGYKMDPLAGWAIGPAPGEPGCEENNDRVEAQNIYTLLEKEVIPLYYKNRSEWINRMRHAIALGSYFNTHRMIREYADKAYNLIEQPRWTTSELL